ncbi:MAG: hypothetical protein M0C28_13825 [Candidatus Moduliflexus flocculans]|nr:hypothetical protein [Candidatus Moduliflexus flocculans]
MSRGQTIALKAWIVVGARRGAAARLARARRRRLGPRLQAGQAALRAGGALGARRPVRRRQPLGRGEGLQRLLHRPALGPPGAGLDPAAVLEVRDRLGRAEHLAGQLDAGRLPACRRRRPRSTRASAASTPGSRNARLKNGLFRCHYDYLIGLEDPKNEVQDACNLGHAAQGYFEAYDLAARCGLSKPEYRGGRARRLRLRGQGPEGRRALRQGLDERRQGRRPRRARSAPSSSRRSSRPTGPRTRPPTSQAAERAYAFYIGAFVRNGFTTAGALDTYCIDKESATPLLKGALELYDVTGKEMYLQPGRGRLVLPRDLAVVLLGALRRGDGPARDGLRHVRRHGGLDAAPPPGPLRPDHRQRLAQAGRADGQGRSGGSGPWRPGPTRRSASRAATSSSWARSGPTAARTRASCTRAGCSRSPSASGSSPGRLGLPPRDPPPEPQLDRVQ